MGPTNWYEDYYLRTLNRYRQANIVGRFGGDGHLRRRRREREFKDAVLRRSDPHATLLFQPKDKHLTLEKERDRVIVSLILYGLTARAAERRPTFSDWTSRSIGSTWKYRQRFGWWIHPSMSSIQGTTSSGSCCNLICIPVKIWNNLFFFLISGFHF